MIPYKKNIFIFIYGIIQFGSKAGLAPVGVCMIRGSSGRDTSFSIKVPTTSKIRRQCTEFRFMWSPIPPPPKLSFVPHILHSDHLACDWRRLKKTRWSEWLLRGDSWYMLNFHHSNLILNSNTLDLTCNNIMNIYLPGKKTQFHACEIMNKSN